MADDKSWADKAREFADEAEIDSETSGRLAKYAWIEALAAVRDALVKSDEAWEAARHDADEAGDIAATAAVRAAEIAQEAVLQAARAQGIARKYTYVPE